MDRGEAGSGWRSRSLAFYTVWRHVEQITLSNQIVQYVFTGITVGSIYALVALGFNIIYNATEVINLAQGEFVMLGGLIMVFFSAMLNLPLALGFVLTVITVTGIGALFERLAIYPLKGASVLTLIIITIAASIVLQGIAMGLWGRDPYDLAAFSGRTPISILGAKVQPQYFWVLGITAIVVILLNLFFNRTIIGKAMAACADNPEAATLVGINVKMMVLLSFSLSAAIGGIAGIVITPVSLMEFDRGPMLAIKGFGAVVFGGLGSFGGAVFAGFLLGVIESLFAGLVHSGYKDAAGLLVLLGVLFIKPSGLFGSVEVAKIKKF
jgi:branched-chain amino acid transport system permease protein